MVVLRASGSSTLGMFSLEAAAVTPTHAETHTDTRLRRTSGDVVVLVVFRARRAIVMNVSLKRTHSLTN